MISIFIFVLAIHHSRAQDVSKKSESKSAEDVYKVVEKMPRFPGCEDKGLEGIDLNQCANMELALYISKKIKYPKKAVENGTQGKAFIEFVIDKTGKLKDIKIIRDPGDGCGEEAARIIKMIGEEHTWIPGILNDEAVNVLITLPIDFKL